MVNIYNSCVGEYEVVEGEVVEVVVVVYVVGFWKCCFQQGVKQKCFYNILLFYLYYQVQDQIDYVEYQDGFFEGFFGKYVQVEGQQGYVLEGVFYVGCVNFQWFEYCWLKFFQEE